MKTMKTKLSLWLDDTRNPIAWSSFSRVNEMDVKWVKTYNEFTQFILENGLPTYMSFDHDLGDFDSDGIEKTGYDCATWLVNYCLDNDLDLPEWGVHSANNVGKKNIESILNNYSKFRNNQTTKN